MLFYHLTLAACTYQAMQPIRWIVDIRIGEYVVHPFILRALLEIPAMRRRQIQEPAEIAATRNAITARHGNALADHCSKSSVIHPRSCIGKFCAAVEAHLRHEFLVA